jgi:hypothetical protein
MGRFIDLTGKSFARLAVLERSVGKDKKRTYWKCLCDCGNIAIVNSGHLISGHTTSCGCFQAEITSVKEPGFNGLLGAYKRGAYRRGIEWSVSEEQFKVLTQSPCYYTGRLPAQIFVASGTRDRSRRGLSPKEGGVYTYNGIDRLDPSKGYTKENCVASCAEANLAKQSLSHDEFIALCHEIAQHHPKV